jgi:hypothetical protein
MAIKKYIVGSFDDEAVLFPAVKKVRKAGYKIHDVYTPFPIHGLDKAMDFVIQAFIRPVLFMLLPVRQQH